MHDWRRYKRGGKKRQKRLLSNVTTIGQQLNRNHIAGASWSGWQCFMAIFASFEEFLELTHCINAVYTIFSYAVFNVPACKMTCRREEPSHNRWQRLKLACPWFVHYDEQIMFLHVYWLFCQMVHQAFQDHTECTLWCKLRKKQHYSQCDGNFFSSERNCCDSPGNK